MDKNQRNKTAIGPKYLWLVGMILWAAPVQAQQSESTCRYFYSRLKFLPNEKLTIHEGTLNSLMYGEEYHGCEVTFVTNDSLLSDVPKPDPIPSFWPKNTASLYENGWRYNKKYDADGPGSHIFGIQKGDTLCLISHSQPATLVEHGKIVQEKDITVTIQCSNISE